MADKPVRCSKCKKTIFYISDKYSMNLQVVCTDCYKGKTGSQKKTKQTQTLSASFAKMKAGVRPQIHPTYRFRSATEANFARILNYLGLQWKYEERAFTFDGYKTKPFIYLMDFEITKGSCALPEGYYEIKGLMKPNDRQKLRRLKKHYPNEFSETTVVVYNKYKKKDIAFCKKLGYKVLLYDELTMAFKDKISGWE